MKMRTVSPKPITRAGMRSAPSRHRLQNDEQSCERQKPVSLPNYENDHRCR